MTIECPKCQFDNPNDTVFCGKCGTNFDIDKGPTKTLETPTEELTRGSIFADRYQIIEELGKGGMGKVYKVLDKEVNAMVALKLIKPEIAADKKTIERFRNELKTARDITHKNVCRMYDLNREKDNYYITMEYVPGGDLKKLIRRTKRLDTGTAISIAKQICDGLIEAHELGIVHRDLKPNNIMIDDNGNARIMDFGIARSIKGKGITGSGIMIGTPEYMSPEQVEAKEVDQRSDIYSLGVILYEMVAGRLPFEGDTPLAIALKHKGDIAKNPKEFNPQIPDDLSGIILKCLEKEKESRFQSAGEVRSKLEMIEQGLPTTDRVVAKKKTLTSKEITVQFSMKKIFIPALAVIAIAVIGLFIWSPWAKNELVPTTKKKSSIAVLPFVDLSPQKDQEYFCDGMTDDIITKLSQLKELKVISRTSAMLYKNTEKDIKRIGQELGVTTVLEGSVQKADNDIRINTKLINVQDGFHLWSDSYDRELKNIFEIQRDIAEKIAVALKAELSIEEKERLGQKPTENLTAYSYYVMGRNYYNGYLKQSNENAIEFFNKAIDLDPNYALAYAGVADAYAQRWRYGYPRKWLDEAIEMSYKAIAIDPNAAEGHKALGLAYQYKGRYRQALESYHRAVELNPNFFTAIANIGWVNNQIGEFDKAFPWLKKAGDLDPMFAFNYYGLGLFYASLDDYIKAEQLLNKALELQPNLVRAIGKLSQVYLEQGKHEQALQFGQRILSIQADEFLGLIVTGDALLFSDDYDQAKQFFEKSIELYSVRRHLFTGSCNATRLGYIYWKTERRDEAKQLLDQSLKFDLKELEQDNENWVIPYDIFSIHVIQNNKEEALNWLEQAIQSGWRNFRLSSMDPMLENIHDDERFKGMMTDVEKMVADMRKRVEKID